MPDATDRGTWWKNVASLYSAFPDLRNQPDDIISEGDTVAVRTTFRGTHKGEFMGVLATGRSVEFQALFFMRFKGGKAVEEWGSIDVTGLMQQLSQRR